MSYLYAVPIILLSYSAARLSA